MNIKKHIKKYIGLFIKAIYRRVYKYISVDEKTILFVAFHGKGYLCNPKYIHKYLSENHEYKNYKFIWALKKDEMLHIPNAKVVRYNGIKYLYYLAKSKYWVVNCRLPRFIIKKPNQVYLQTWHGTPLKRLGHDIEIAESATFYRTEITRKEMTELYDKDSIRYNYLISPNKFSTDKFQSAFNINRDKIIETGYPRNDYLTNLNENEIIKLKEKYNISKNKKVILYAPTWRDNSYNNRGYTFTLKVDFNKWKKELGDEYVVIFKPHYLISNTFDVKDFKGFIYTVRENADINELYAISDILVTDYSSVFFDYSNLKRPIFFYMYDLEQYRDNLRGFYLDIYNDLPGPIYRDEKSLLKNIINIHQEEVAKKLDIFNKRFNELEDGICCKRVVDIVFQKERRRT